MRISTSQLFSAGASGIQTLQADLYRTQNQMSTGRRILTPQDDPIGASEALKYEQLKGVNTQFLDNQSGAATKLSLVEGVLNSVGDALVSVLPLAVQAGQVSATSRSLLVPELKERLNHLLDLANTKDGTGLYIFSGYKSSTQPFQVNTASTSPYSAASPSVSYNGDGGVEAIQVTATQTMETSTNGLEIFMQVKDDSGNIVGRSVFDALKNLIDILDPSSGVTYTGAAQTQAVADLNASLSNVLSHRASVGARLNSLESMTTTGEDLSLQYDARLSKLRDLDYTEAISRLSNTQMQLEAAQLSFRQISQLSLFSIL